MTKVDCWASWFMFLEKEKPVNYDAAHRREKHTDGRGAGHWWSVRNAVQAVAEGGKPL